MTQTNPFLAVYASIVFFLFQIFLYTLAGLSLVQLLCTLVRWKKKPRRWFVCTAMGKTIAGMAFYTMYIYQGDPTSAQQFLITALACLSFSTICAILEKIVWSRSVMQVVNNLISRLLNGVGRVQGVFERIHDFFHRYPYIAIACPIVSLVFGLVIAKGRSETDVAFIMLIFLTLAYCFYLAYALHSCRHLLLLLFVFAGMYTIQVGPLVFVILNKSENSLTEWGFILICYTALWCITALVSEKDPVQLVFKIANTFTTILAIAGNIAVPYWAKRFPEGMVEGYSTDMALMIIFNALILPLVAAGYLAQLTKDIQIYLQSKYTP